MFFGNLSRHGLDHHNRSMILIIGRLALTFLFLHQILFTREILAGSTTETPTIEIPTTQVLTTQVSTTQVSTTQVSTTQVSTTQASTAQIPTTQVPIPQVPETAIDTPLQNVSARAGHTVTLINGRLYIIGGSQIQPANPPPPPGPGDPRPPPPPLAGPPLNYSNFVADSFLVLDVSKNFSVKTPPWEQLNSPNYTFLVGHSALSGGLNNSQIIVFGGASPATFGSSLLTYDTVNRQWSDPLTNAEPTRRFFHSATVKNNGEMFIYGGVLAALDSFNVTPFSDFWALDTVSLQGWFAPSTVPTPGNRARHTASILGNKIILLGGADGRGGFFDLAQVTYFDMISGSWVTVTATGVVPKQRRDHSAVVRGNDEIIVYGGNQPMPLGDAAVLNTTNWTWSIPSLINPPAPRFLHSATLVGRNMIVAFGISGGAPDNNIYVLDTLTWNWLSTYSYQRIPDKNISTPPPPVPAVMINPENSKTALIVGLSVGGAVLFFAIVGIVAFVLFRKRQIRKRQRSFVVVNRPPPPPNMMTPRPERSRPRMDRPSLINVMAVENDTRFLDPTLSVPSTPHTPDNTYHTPSNSQSLLLRISDGLSPSSAEFQRRSISDMLEPAEASRYSSESLEYGGNFDVQNFVVRRAVLRLANPSDPEPD